VGACGSQRAPGARAAARTALLDALVAVAVFSAYAPGGVVGCSGRTRPEPNQVTVAVSVPPDAAPQVTEDAGPDDSDLPPLAPLSRLPVPPDAALATCRKATVSAVVEAVVRLDASASEAAKGCPDLLVAVLESQWDGFQPEARLLGVRAMAAQGGALAWHGLMFALERALATRDEPLDAVQAGTRTGAAMLAFSLVVAQSLSSLTHQAPADRVLAAAVKESAPVTRSVLYRVAGNSAAALNAEQRQAVIVRLRQAAALEAQNESRQAERGVVSEVSPWLIMATEGLDPAPSDRSPARWVRAVLVKLGDPAARRALLATVATVDDLPVIEYLGDQRLLRLALPLLESEEVGFHLGFGAGDPRVKDLVVDLALQLGVVTRDASKEKGALWPRHSDSLIAETKRAVLALPPP
jgi:hypothetical protein